MADQKISAMPAAASLADSDQLVLASAGANTSLTGAALRAALRSGGIVIGDSIWDAKGDLAVATGADSAAKLPVGANGQVLTADSAQATGVKWAAVAASGGMTKLFDTTLGSNATSFDTGAGGIPGGYVALDLFAYIRSTNGTAGAGGLLQFNADTGANYDWQRMSGTGTTPGVNESQAAAGIFFRSIRNSFTANIFTAMRITIPYYDGTANKKSAVGHCGHGEQVSAQGDVATTAGTWRNTSAITRVVFVEANGTNFLAGSRLIIFGLG